MPYYESDYDYDTECFMKEQRDYQRYYNTPLEVGGVWFSSLADYEEFLRLQENEKVRLQKMTIALKSLIQQMVIEEKIEKMFATEFPELK
jgi:hypothetical protein